MNRLLILAVMSSPGWASGLPKPSAQPGQVRFTASLLKDTVRIGEPLLVTCVLKNPTADTQYIPATVPVQTFDLGSAHYSLLDSQGRSFWQKAYQAIDGTILSSRCVPVAPGDSVYWHDLVSLDHYYVADTGPTKWFTQSPGSFRLVVAVSLPEYAAGDPFPKRGFSFADTLPFSMVLDSVLSSRIKPYSEVLSHGLWSLFFTVRQPMDSFVMLLTPRPVEFDVTYPYLEYLIPHALSQVKGRSSEAIPEARHFTESHQGHPLSEEMAFDMWEFLRRSGFRASQDSLAQVLLKTYPRNTRVRRLQQSPR